MRGRVNQSAIGQRSAGLQTVIMKVTASTFFLILALACAVGSVRAADPANGNGKGNENGNGNGNGKPDKIEKPERPDKGGNGASDDNAKDTKSDLKTEFKAQAEALRKKQKELVAQVKHANLEQRAKIREQLVTLKENWKELNREYRDKLDDLKDKVDRESIQEERGSGKPRK
jgi:hypothetical protein